MTENSQSLIPSARPSVLLAAFAVGVVLLSRGLGPALQGAVVGLSDTIDFLAMTGEAATQLLFITLMVVALGLLSAWAQLRAPFLLKLYVVALTVPICFVALATMAVPRTHPVMHLLVCVLSSLAAVGLGLDAAIRRNLHAGIPIAIGLAALLRGVSSYLSESAIVTHHDLATMGDRYQQARMCSTIAHGLLGLALVLAISLMLRQSKLRGGLSLLGLVGFSVLSFVFGQTPPAELESVGSILLVRLGLRLSSLPPPLFPPGLEHVLALAPLLVATGLLVSSAKGERRTAACLALVILASVNAEVPLLGLCLLCGGLGYALERRDPHGVFRAGQA